MKLTLTHHNLSAIKNRNEYIVCGSYVDKATFEVAAAIIAQLGIEGRVVSESEFWKLVEVNKI